MSLEVPLLEDRRSNPVAPLNRTFRQFIIAAIVGIVVFALLVTIANIAFLFVELHRSEQFASLEGSVRTQQAALAAHETAMNANQAMILSRLTELENDLMAVERQEQELLRQTSGGK